MTKKSFIKIFICIFVFVLMIGFWIQYNTFSTVLYEDGTLMIEQRSLKQMDKSIQSWKYCERISIF